MRPTLGFTPVTRSGRAAEPSERSALHGGGGTRGWTRGWRADLAAAGAGLLSAAALPPVNLIPVLLVSVPVLLLLIGAARTPWVAARRGWLFGFAHHLFGLYWITEAILFEAARLWWAVPLAVPALAALLAAFIALPCAVSWWARPGWPRALVLAGAWVLADLARQFIATGFPWNPWGSVWELPGRAGDVMIQPAAWVGVHGLTLATILLAATPLLGRRAWAGGACVLAAWIGAGLWRLSGPLPLPAQATGQDGAPAGGIQVILVQGNVAQGQKWSGARAAAIFDQYLDLTRQGVAEAGPGAKVVVWPETASPYLLVTDAGARAAISAAAGQAPVLAGSVRYDAAERPRNSLVVIEPGGRVGSIYDKWHLVPFGEFQPDWFPLPFQVVPGGGFAAGSGPATLRIAGLPPVGPIICYEAIYSGELVDTAGRPAWLANITNDAWFGNSSGPRQHLAAARLRAVESGLPLMRAANTGITAGFDAYGHEIHRLPTNRPGTLIVALPGALGPTVYFRAGLAFSALLALISLLMGSILSYFTPPISLKDGRSRCYFETHLVFED